jgi:hydrogenase maturation protein HypF
VLNSPLKQTETKERRHYTIRGAVQGVGFRPFVYRLATEYRLCGWVQNNASGVIIEVEGDTKDIKVFESQLQEQKPPHAVINHFKSMSLNLKNDEGFRIIQSDNNDDISASILPDLAVCKDCLQEMNDPTDRRYRYPFINCTNCGPRYTIMTALPYDRPYTSMAGFEMCATCRTEYQDPLNRRFHAQPIACPDCGPHLELWDEKGNVISAPEDALAQAVLAIRGGKIVALKGLGGFHLMCDAGNERAIQLLRERKHRKTKPFAVMYPSLDTVRKDCFVSEKEEKLLCSAAAPIVLLQHKIPPHIAPSVAPGNPYLGVMLPYTPLHYLLSQEIQSPVIATSGNRVSEPICIDEQEALERLSGIADMFLVHNRPIINRSDDSIVRMMAGREMILRRGRGYAPLPIMMKQETQKAVLAVGGHLKNTVAFAKGNRLMLSPHIGDLDTPEACAAHEKAADALINLYREKPALAVHDAHPDYRSTQMAQDHFKKGHFENCLPVQHHYAHALSCMVDNGIDAPCFAVAWDGTGYGDDGTVWGGEFLNISKNCYKRASHFLPFPLPGGEAAIHDPQRSAFGALYAMGRKPPENDAGLIWQAMEKNINAPLTSSAGRLFDAVAALTGICEENSFEGEAAMALEFVAIESDTKEVYGFEIYDSVIDWRPMLLAILNETGEDKSKTARKFHNTLAAVIVAAAQKQEQKRTLLTGGCFQNKLLLESAVEKLEQAGFEPYWHRQIPPNDGGLAAGQIMAAQNEIKGREQA